MDHKKFLLIVAQLLSKKGVSIMAFGLDMSVERTERPDRWKLLTLLYQGDGEIPPRIKECVSPNGSFKWQKMGPHLSLDVETQALFLIEEIPAAKEYLPFKELVYHFVQVAAEWEEMLFDLHQS